MYRSAVRAHSAVWRLSQAVIDGVALGMLDRAGLSQLDHDFYDGAAEIVMGEPVFYQDERNIRQGLFDWERRAVREAFPPGARVIISAAGAGREVLALCEQGFDAWGYEPHAGLLAAGDEVLRRHGFPGRLKLSARDHWPSDAGRADAVVIGWGSYMLIPTRQRRIALLRGARSALPAGGPLLVSFTARSGRTRELRVVAALAGFLRRLRRGEPVELGDWLAPNFVHLFSETEVRKELGAAGFCVVRYAAFPYGHAVGRVAS